MTDFSKILDKAKELENKMKESQEKIKNINATGVSGANSVKVTLSGDGELKNIDLSDDILKEEKGIIEDLIKAAHNNAKIELKSKTTEEISKTTGGFPASRRTNETDEISSTDFKINFGKSVDGTVPCLEHQIQVFGFNGVSLRRGRCFTQVETLFFLLRCFGEKRYAARTWIV